MNALNYPDVTNGGLVDDGFRISSDPIENKPCNQGATRWQGNVPLPVQALTDILQAS
jgi:hypothetical protein